MPTHDSIAFRLHSATDFATRRWALPPAPGPAAAGEQPVQPQNTRLDADYGCVDWYIYPTPVTVGSVASPA